MEEKRRNIFSLIFYLVLILIFGYFAIQQRVRQRYRIFWTNGYFYLIYSLIVINFIFLLTRKSNLFKKLKEKLRNLNYIIFLPIVFLPIFRCYFRIPYIFCRICPKKCPWGELRPIIIPFVLLLNTDKRFWCFNLCPLGTLQRHQCKLNKKRIKLPRWLKNIRYIFLLFTIVIVIKLTIGIRQAKYSLLIGVYHPVILTILIASVILILAFFIPLFWCEYFCPIGSFSDLVLRLEDKFNRKK